MKKVIRFVAWFLLTCAVLEFIGGGVPTGRILLLSIWGIFLYYVSLKNNLKDKGGTDAEIVT